MRSSPSTRRSYGAATGLTPAAERRQADLFFADLMGCPVGAATAAPMPVPELMGPVELDLPPPEWVPPPQEEVDEDAALEDAGQEDAGLGEAVPLRGRGHFRHDALGGAGDNVEARWNVDASTAAGSTIDVVVHLHGYGAPRADFLARKALAAGVDLLDAAGAVRVRAARPTLALVPRGRHDGGSRWVFDTLPDRAAFDALVDAALSWLCLRVLRLPPGSTLVRGRLTLMAHSGGGAGLSALLGRGVDPDEVACFDSLYGREADIRRWATARIASAQATRSGLRAFYTGCGGVSAQHPGGRWLQESGGAPVYQQPGSWAFWASDRRWHLITTEVSARRLHHALQSALASAANGAALAGRFRVERTVVGHNDIPRRYSPPLLDDIAANVPGGSPPPPSSSRPACVANDDWLTQAPRKPHGDDPPPPRPAAAAEAVLEMEDVSTAVEDVYTAADARAYTPSASAAVFRVPPEPAAVSPATQWPETAADADAASQGALRALGVNAAGVTAYAGAGLTALRPIATCFGEAALTELFRRLRYTPARLARPPHSYDDDDALNRAFGRPARPALLALRTLVAIPGHFRELARRAGTEPEAYALENAGWLLLQSLREEVRRVSGLDFWMPTSPAFVTAFANPLPALSPQLSRLIVARALVDTSLAAAQYEGRFSAWRTGAPGRLWRLETGRETVAGRAAGLPFYPELFTIPATINIAPQRAQVQAAWARRLAAFDSGATRVPLTRCDNSYLATLGVMARIGLRGLQLRGRFPSPSTAPSITTLTGLGAVQPAFEAAFQAIADLGWNDLLVETQGMGCLRGQKITGSATAARRMSEHSLGIAIDVNAFENVQNTSGCMDPRIVALFEAFRFRWGKGFPTPDPMHFEYAG